MIITLTELDSDSLNTNVRKIELENHPDKAIIDLAKNQGIFLKSSCGGKGKCGRCMINLLEGRFLVRDKEIVVSKSNPRKALSCITRVSGDHARIEIPQESLIEASGMSMSSGISDIRICNCLIQSLSIHEVKKIKF